MIGLLKITWSASEGCCQLKIFSGQKTYRITIVSGPQTRKGDSGGGLIYKDGRTNFVVGIVSTTVSKPNFWVSFYTNVSYHSDWIQANMK